MSNPFPVPRLPQGYPPGRGPAASQFPATEAAPRRPVLVASNVLLNDRDEVLFGLRTDNNLWEVPGGKLEAEYVLDGARREMREETGIELLGQPISLGFADTWGMYGQDGGPWYVCLMLLWREWRGFPQLLEGKHREWKWFPLSNLPLVGCVTPGTVILLTDLLPKSPYFAGYAAHTYPGAVEASGTTDILPFVGR